MLAQMSALVADVLVKRQMGLNVKFIIASFNNISKANIAITTITLFSVFLRMFVRLKMLRQFGREDWAMVLTTMLYIVHSAMLFSISEVGKKYIGGNFKLMNKFNSINRVGNGFFALTMVALKFSLGFFFLRIIGHKKPQRYTIWALMGLTLVSGSLYFGLATFTCAQVKDVGVLTGPRCHVQKTSTYIFAVFSVVNIVSDFVMTLIALFALWKAKLPIITKLIAGSLLALGCVGGIASIVRLVIVLQPVDLFGYIRQLFNSGLWLSIEIAVGIIAANFAMVRPILQLFLEKMHLVSTQAVTKSATAPATYGRSGIRNTHLSHKSHRDQGDDVLLDEIRKETTVMVTEEEKGIENLHIVRATAPRQLP
ncbi:hypothetical protein BDZ85DRAFT_284135 [Elsinoe ampelina]|uniref:Rhodopsin domain-containing protein n=1 Tax=Elsinoe ampelina TaxID=302913 RepID=A0A6A6G3Q0_9PEZI|nr:hypothetical protein BDZ85DRAFT_284135 [Elsinoe ampelina]